MNNQIKKINKYYVMVLPILCGVLMNGALLNAHEAASAAHQSTVQVHTKLTKNDREVSKDIQKHCQEAETLAQRKIIPEAIAVIDETKKALEMLDKAGGVKESLAAIERATGKINILLARYEEAALLPVDFKVRVIDTAPSDINKIREMSANVAHELEIGHYPDCRHILKYLESEVDIRTECLPLALYPTALLEAARCLEKGNVDEAKNVLKAVLNTLTVQHHAIPIPLIKAQTLLEKAAEKDRDDKDIELKLITEAEKELDRARELGYFHDLKEYAVLHTEFKDLEKHVKHHKNSYTDCLIVKGKVEEATKRLYYLNQF